MDCAAIRDALKVGRLPDGEAAEDHLRACAICRELVADDGAVGRALAVEPSDAASVPAEEWPAMERLLAAEKGPRAWLRSRGTPVRALVALAVGAVAAAVGWLSGAGVLFDAPSVFWLTAFALAAVVGLGFVLAPLGRPRPERSAARVLALAALALPLGHALASFAPGPDGGTFVVSSFGCFVFGTIISIPFLFVFWLLERDDVGPARLLLRAGAISGLVANAALLLHCPSTAPLHLAAGHATVGAALVLLGALLTSRPAGATP